MADPRELMLELYGDTAQPVELFGASDELSALPFQQQAQEVSVPQNLSRRIQEVLGAAEPDSGGQVRDILSARFNNSGPSFNDYAQGLMSAALGKHETAQSFGDSRMGDAMKTLAFINKLESEQADSAFRNRQFEETMRHNRAYEGIMERRANMAGGAGGQTKPPSGYRWLPNGDLEPIPGGPGTAISAELSARLGLANKFLGESGELTQKAKSGEATGPLDYAWGAMGYGESGKIQRRIADGADALQRMLTGAGMPQSEAVDYANRFRATAFDTSDTLTDKLTNLEKNLRAQMEMATRGKGFKPVAPDVDPRVQAALDAGYTMEEIEQYLSGGQNAAP